MPQNYRFIGSDFFSRGCYWEYWQFFEIGMVLRAERNAAMLHGTMCLINKKALASVGGWGEWCLTEDSELGLRILCAGYQGVYLKKSYGYGLLPFKFIDYKRQRWRWVIGGAQQLRMYVFGERRALWERAQFRAASVYSAKLGAMVSEPLIVVSFLLLFLSASALPWFPETITPIVVLCTTIAFVLFQHVVRQTLISLTHLRLSIWDAFYTFLAIFSLTITVGLAVLFGLSGYRENSP